MEKLVYPACFYEEDDGKFSVIFPDFNCATFGDNLEDAMAMAEECLSLQVISCIHGGEEIPKPSRPGEVKADEYPNGFVSLVAVNADAFRDTKAVKKTLTIPAWLDKAAMDKSINFSKVLQDALKEQIDL